jgi:transposase
LTFYHIGNISHWNAIVEESNNGFDIWVGVDVHKRSYSVSLLSENGVMHNFRIPADNQTLLNMFSSRAIKITCLLYEAGPTGFTLARTCQAAGAPVMVVAANRIPRPAALSAKTDAIDSLKLVTLAAKGMLIPIAIPTEEQEAKRGLMRRRNQLVKSIRNAKLRIKALMLCHGLAEPSGLRYWSKSGKEQLVSRS